MSIEQRRFLCDDALSRLTPEQRELAEFMGQLSEERYCAGWLAGLEFILWRDVVVGYDLHVEEDGDHAFAEETAKLRALSEKCGGWITWPDDAHGETFVALDDWKRQYAEASR